MVGVIAVTVVSVFATSAGLVRCVAFISVVAPTRLLLVSIIRVLSFVLAVRAALKSVRIGALQTPVRSGTIADSALTGVIIGIAANTDDR